MAKKPKLKNPLLVTIIRVIQGILIGAGAILPGISGGVLCVVFGIYRPMMALLAHPKENLPRYGRMLLPVGVGWVLGFAVFAWLIKILFDASETMAVILFIGLIAGTIPSLYREAGKMGRSKSGYLGMIGGFLVLFTLGAEYPVYGNHAIGGLVFLLRNFLGVKHDYSRHDLIINFDFFGVVRAVGKRYGGA